MINENSYGSDVANELGLIGNPYGNEVAGEVSLTSAAYGNEVATAINDGTVRVLQFNIGHFNQGAQPAPTDNNPTTTTVQINSSKSDGYPNSLDRNYDIQEARWKNFISSINADIIGIEEYNKYFGWDGGVVKELGDTDIFDGYHISVGRMGQSIFSGGNVRASGWQWNALASKRQMLNPADYELGSTGVSIAKCYTHFARVNIKGKSVIIASTHLNWAQNSDAVTSRAIEISTLVSWLENEPYVILMGDFNTDGAYKENKTEADYLAGADAFDPFLEAGFTLANHGDWGDMMTASATGSRPDLSPSWKNAPFAYIDNIIVKGFTMSNVQVLNLDALGDGTIDVGMISDHCAVVADLTII